jgi:hypothetical protein
MHIKMQEAEVSIHVALYYLRNQLTDKDVHISIDGAHIKTKETVHFEIESFLDNNSAKKINVAEKSWQGEYIINGIKPKLVISSKPGVGDVRIHLTNEKVLYIESKKGDTNKKGLEYKLIREAIGQLMTGFEFNENVIPAVAVPYTDKSYDLAKRWSNYSQIKLAGIQFILVKNDSSIFIVK